MRLMAPIMHPWREAPRTWDIFPGNWPTSTDRTSGNVGAFTATYVIGGWTPRSIPSLRLSPTYCSRAWSDWSPWVAASRTKQTPSTIASGPDTISPVMWTTGGYPWSQLRISLYWGIATCCFATRELVVRRGDERDLLFNRPKPTKRCHFKKYFLNGGLCKF